MEASASWRLMQDGSIGTEIAEMRTVGDSEIDGWPQLDGTDSLALWHFHLDGPALMRGT
jgi:hypothetical protein